MSLSRCRILVESESAAHFISEKTIGNDIIWYTTSPWLLEKLYIQGAPVNSLESNKSMDGMAKLGILGYVIAEILSSAVMDRFLAPSVGGRPLFGVIQKTFLVLAYKAYLIQEWLDETNNCINIIVGMPQLTDVDSFSVSVGRFDTIFMAVASEASKEGWDVCELIPFQSPEKGKDHIEKMLFVGQSLEERMFSLVNMPLSTMVYKFFKKLSVLKNTNFNLGEGKEKVIILRECELLEETVPFLSFTGMKLLFDDLFWLKRRLIPREFDISENSFLDCMFHKCLMKYDEMGVPVNSLQEAVLRILIHRVFAAARFAEPLLKRIQKHFNFLISNGPKDKKNRIIFVTNGLTSPGERLIYQYAREQRIPLFAFEHGITEGLSHLSDYQSQHSGINESDKMICFTQGAWNHHQKHGNFNKGGVVSGAPKRLKNIRARFIQNMILRFILRVGLRNRTIVYATLATQNNMIYGPYGQNDIIYYQVTKKMIVDVLSQIKDTCIVKLYPTNRYLDPDPFASIITKPKNVKLIQYFEFRYIRPIADLIIIDSPQSTLGWAWSIKAPLIFLDLPSNPLLPEVAEAFDKAIFRIDCSKDSWDGEVKKLLSIPNKELLRLWKEKEPVRRKVEEKYIFGPPGNSGKRAAKFIIEETRKWYGNNSIEGEVRGEKSVMNK